MKPWGEYLRDLTHGAHIRQGRIAPVVAGFLVTFGKAFDDAFTTLQGLARAGSPTRAEGAELDHHARLRRQPTQRPDETLEEYQARIADGFRLWALGGTAAGIEAWLEQFGFTCEVTPVYLDYGPGDPRPDWDAFRLEVTAATLEHDTHAFIAELRRFKEAHSRALLLVDDAVLAHFDDGGHWDDGGLWDEFAAPDAAAGYFDDGGTYDDAGTYDG